MSGTLSWTTVMVNDVIMSTKKQYNTDTSVRLLSPTPDSRTKISDPVSESESVKIFPSE